ncbi:hypothetical protein HK098_007839 [Nowakowskiella sp. JEL0407]|nr:hypothetical protein HK098_007839 [Nowakowskiella sp. JEL0407]
MDPNNYPPGNGRMNQRQQFQQNYPYQQQNSNGPPRPVYQNSPIIQQGFTTPQIYSPVPMNAQPPQSRDYYRPPPMQAPPPRPNLVPYGSNVILPQQQQYQLSDSPQSMPPQPPPGWILAPNGPPPIVYPLPRPPAMINPYAASPVISYNNGPRPPPPNQMGVNNNDQYNRREFRESPEFYSPKVAPRQHPDIEMIQNSNRDRSDSQGSSSGVSERVRRGGNEFLGGAASSSKGSSEGSKNSSQTRESSMSDGDLYDDGHVELDEDLYDDGNVEFIPKFSSPLGNQLQGLKGQLDALKINSKKYSDTDSLDSDIQTPITPRSIMNDKNNSIPSPRSNRRNNRESLQVSTKELSSPKSEDSPLYSPSTPNSASISFSKSNRPLHSPSGYKNPPQFPQAPVHNPQSYTPSPIPAYASPSPYASPQPQYIAPPQMSPRAQFAAPPPPMGQPPYSGSPGPQFIAPPGSQYQGPPRPQYLVNQQIPYYSQPNTNRPPPISTDHQLPRQRSRNDLYQPRSPTSTDHSQSSNNSDTSYTQSPASMNILRKDLNTSRKPSVSDLSQSSTSINPEPRTRKGSFTDPSLQQNQPQPQQSQQPQQNPRANKPATPSPLSQTFIDPLQKAQEKASISHQQLKSKLAHSQSYDALRKNVRNSLFPSSKNTNSPQQQQQQKQQLLPPTDRVVPTNNSEMSQFSKNSGVSSGGDVGKVKNPDTGTKTRGRSFSDVTAKSQVASISEETDNYRKEAKKSHDPQVLLDFARYLMECAKKFESDATNSTKGIKQRDEYNAEALKVIKKLGGGGLTGKPPYPEALFFLAECYGNGSLGLPIDHREAFNLYIQASKLSHPAATYRSAVCYEIGAGARKDSQKAVQFYKKAAVLGDTAAMYKYGMIMLKGTLEQHQNLKEGITWLKRAKEQADESTPHAVHELGLLYEGKIMENTSIIPDPAYALELFLQAANLGYAPSQYKLGLVYEYGLLDQKVDARRSIAWYARAASQEEPEAELALSGWYLTGAETVLEQNDTEAYLWARKAADKGLAKAEYAVGYYCEHGVGVEQSVGEAKIWYNRAAKQGNKRAAQRLKDLKGGQTSGLGRKATKGEWRQEQDAKNGECLLM